MKTETLWEYAARAAKMTEPDMRRGQENVSENDRKNDEIMKLRIELKKMTLLTDKIIGELKGYSPSTQIMELATHAWKYLHRMEVLIEDAPEGDLRDRMVMIAKNTKINIP